MTNPGPKTETVKIVLFDHLKIEIKAETIEFRRSINLHFRGSLNMNTMKAPGSGSKAKDYKEGNAQADDGGDMDLAEALKSKGKRSK